MAEFWMFNVGDHIVSAASVMSSTAAKYVVTEVQDRDIEQKVYITDITGYRLGWYPSGVFKLAVPAGPRRKKEKPTRYPKEREYCYASNL